MPYENRLFYSSSIYILLGIPLVSHLNMSYEAAKIRLIYNESKTLKQRQTHTTAPATTKSAAAAAAAEATTSTTSTVVAIAKFSVTLIW